MNLKVFIPGDSPVSRALRQILDSKIQVGSQEEASVVITVTLESLLDHYLKSASSTQDFVLFGLERVENLPARAIWVEGSLVPLLTYLQTKA
jgi:hypothetical protein